MSNTLLNQYKSKFSKALDFIIEDLRLSEDEVQELLTWMTKTTRNRIFRPTEYASDTAQPKELDSNNFEAVFIPDLDELNTKAGSKDKKNEIPKPSTISSKPSASQGTGTRKAVASKTSTVPSKTTGRAVAKGSTKPPIPKLGGINTKQLQQKAKVAGKAEKAPVKAAPTAPAPKANPIKQVSTRQSIKPIQAITKPSKPKN